MEQDTPFHDYTQYTYIPISVFVSGQYLFAFLDRLMIFGMWLYNDETVSQYHHDHSLTLTFDLEVKYFT
jgi:hypothetical protein